MFPRRVIDLVRTTRKKQYSSSPLAFNTNNNNVFFLPSRPSASRWYSAQPVEHLLNLRSKTAIVTGCGGNGIGRAIALRLAMAGANVVLTDINSTALQHTQDYLSDQGFAHSTLTVTADVREPHDVTQLVQRTIDSFQFIDILVNNVGIFPFTPFSKLDPAAWHHVLDTNVKGAFLCTQKVSERMIAQNAPPPDTPAATTTAATHTKRGGRIVNISSIVARRPSPVGLVNHDVSKHGVIGLTKSTALLLAPHGILVNAVLPGTINTERSQKHVAELSKHGFNIDLSMVAKRIPLGRQGTPDDIAKAVLFLSSDMSSYVTGTEILVDGGWLLI